MNKKTYTAEFRAQALAKVFARAVDQGINEIAAGLHVNAGTLKGWMRTATRAQKSLSPSTVRAADFSLAERLLALHETHGMGEEALQGWCRQRGVFARDLAQWREAFCTLGGREARQQEALELRELRLAHAQLQREMTRKDRALAEAAALLVLQKKYRALWAAEDA